MPHESVNGTTIDYTQAGSGPNLVLVHGFPLSSQMWEKQIAALADRNRVIAPDLRGFGKSPSLDPFTMESLADDVHTLLDRIEALPCVLAGLSMGGYVALAYCKKYPRDLRGLILIDTRAEGDTAEGKQGRQKMIELVREAGSAAVAEQMLPKMLCEQTCTGVPDVSQALRKIMESCPPLTIEHALLALRDRKDQTENLPSIPVPTLILVGEHDAITPPAMSQKMHELIPQSMLATIPCAGHMSPIENPDEVNRHIREFLATIIS
jgi:pimeloyl-ACP methyl ester carboxylesterase